MTELQGKPRSVDLRLSRPPNLAPEILEHERTILVIEDDAEMRKLIAKSLERSGYAVAAVGSGGEAVDWLGLGIAEDRVERVPALLVSDLRLPDFSGLELLEALAHAGVRVPTIVITAFPSTATYYEALTLGAARILEKPFGLEELSAAVRSVLGERFRADPRAARSRAPRC